MLATVLPRSPIAGRELWGFDALPVEPADSANGTAGFLTTFILLVLSAF